MWSADRWKYPVSNAMATTSSAPHYARARPTHMFLCGMHVHPSRYWRAKQAQCLVMSIEICDICVYVGMFFSVIDTWQQNYWRKRTRMPNKTIIAKETEKNKRCTRYCSNDSSSASLALLASYSPLNARLDALLSPVSYRWSSGAVSSHGRGEVKGQVVWAWSI